MQHRKLSLALAGLILMTATAASHAGIVFTNLGASAPPASVGGLSLTPFDLTPQAALPEYSLVSVIPGSPVTGTLSTSFPVQKYTAGQSWGSSWSHGYTGPIYYADQDAVVLTLPAGSKAFYFYAQPNYYGSYAMTVTTDTGTSSGPISVSTGYFDPGQGANGFAFHADAGETITTVTISSPSTGGFAFGEFGINAGPTTTCASEGYTGTKLEWCKNICERDYTGSTLNMWIRRWIDRYRNLPYCAIESQPVPTLR